MDRSRVWFLSAFALTFLMACGDDDANDGTAEPEMIMDEPDAGGEPDAGTPDADDPEPDPQPEALPEMPWAVDEPGFYGVGFRSGEVTYTPPGSDGDRTLRLVIWYPTLDEEGKNATYGGLLPQQGIFEDASVAIDEPAPVLVFSHGSTSFAEQSFFMTEFFTSHGWIVVAMDHTGNTFNDRTNGIPPEVFGNRPQDITAVIDHVQALPDGDPLAGLLSDDIILSGHSFGGYTTLAVSGAAFNVNAVTDACDGNDLPDIFCDYFLDEEIIALFVEGFTDERVKVAIPQAPFGGPVFGDGVANIDIPVLLFTATGDITLPPEQDGDPIWAGLDGPDDIRVDMVTGGHFTFSNACGLGLGIGENDGCGPAFISAERAFFVVNTFSMAFARKHLFDDDSNDDILDGTRELDGDLMLFDNKE